MRSWNIRIVLVHENTGEDVTANVFEKATYKLHPTFGDREIQGMLPIQCSLDNFADSRALWQ